MATTGVLLAASKMIGSTCREENKEFMLCKQADANPEACVGKGEKVVSCVIGLMEKLNGPECGESFRNYQECLASNDNKFEKCRETQAIFEAAFAEAS